METILKIRDICRAHTKCFDGCPLYADGECLVCIPPANLSDEQLYLISKALEGEECQLVRSVKEATYEELKEVVNGETNIQAKLEFIRRNSIYGLNFGKDYEKIEQEFHCGVEESGGHAYNCNDCPNKCDVYYQWDKEMKDEHIHK